MVDNILNSLSKDELVDKISVLQEQIVQLNNELLCELYSISLTKKMLKKN